MEALAALSLACNVITVVTFARDLLDTYSRLAKDGSPEPRLQDDLNKLDRRAKHLKDHCNDFDSVVHTGPAGAVAAHQVQNEARDELKQIAESLIQDVESLRKLLEKVTPKGPDPGRTERWKLTVTYKLKYRQRIGALRDNIGTTHARLNAEFLSRIWYEEKEGPGPSTINVVPVLTQPCCSTSTQASDARAQARFQELDTDIKLFITRWSEGERNMVALIVAGTAEIKAHMDTKTDEVVTHMDRNTENVISHISESDDRAMNAARNERLLKTLWFDEMNARENQIEDTKDPAAEWVFSDKSPLPGWLQSKDAVFWVSGKPGSGKSTIMKYLVRHETTANMLRRWEPNCIVLRFYLVELGSNPLQRTIQGCLRTLLFQLLAAVPSLINTLFATKPELSAKLSGGDWSDTELKDCLTKCLENLDTSCCLFLDGLDESHRDKKRHFVHLVKQLSQIPKFKICVSSRPENVFQSGLGEYPTLKVQDINYPGIKSHIELSLEPYWKSIGSPSQEQRRSLVRKLADKSQGVFLWVKIALNSILRGIDNGDQWSVIQQREDHLEEELYPLYKQIWYRHNIDSHIYKHESARLFWFMIDGERYFPARAVTAIASSSDMPLADVELFSEYEMSETMDKDALFFRERARFQRYERWIFARSAGLLELYFTPGPHGIGIRFTHRSVREFLVSTSNGHQILTHDQRLMEVRWGDVTKAACRYAQATGSLFALSESDFLLYSKTIAHIISRAETDTTVQTQYASCLPDEFNVFLQEYRTNLEEYRNTAPRGFKSHAESLSSEVLANIWYQMRLFLAESTDLHCIDPRSELFGANAQGALLPSPHWRDWYQRLAPRCKSLTLFYFCHHVRNYIALFDGDITAVSFRGTCAHVLHPLVSLALRWMVENGADPACRFGMQDITDCGDFLGESAMSMPLSSLEAVLALTSVQVLVFPGDTMFKWVNILRFPDSTKRDLLPLAAVPFIHFVCVTDPRGPRNFDLRVSWGWNPFNREKRLRSAVCGRINGVLYLQWALSSEESNEFHRKIPLQGEDENWNEICDNIQTGREQWLSFETEKSFFYLCSKYEIKELMATVNPSASYYWTHRVLKNDPWRPTIEYKAILRALYNSSKSQDGPKRYPYQIQRRNDAPGMAVSRGRSSSCGF